ncbi:MAG: LysR substrate-binding domain-containing protein [Burkholderiaceae bacterium]|jgi:DNA-binding transcriptional LysR family regulator|nr:LysR substrate-binding domain-containing protein [Burkholderiaceae bacterium]
MFNLRSVDLNLLPVFEAAYEEQTLSRAAQRLAMTQSAVSHALSRLRQVFNDELFVRKGRGVVPTPAATSIYRKLHGALGAVRQSVSESRRFDPRTSTRSFFISVSHPLGPLMAVRLLEQLAEAAPDIKVAFTTRSRPIELDRALRDGRVDAAIDWLVPASGPFNGVTLFDDEIVAVARSEHPDLRKTRTIEDLKRGRFVSLRRRVEGESPVPGIQEWSRLQLNIALEVSEILEVFMVASRSDLFGLIPHSMLKIARDTLGLRALPVQVTTKSFPIKMVWSAGREADPAQVFIRKQIGLASRAVVGRGFR